jgi:serine/threonine protein kinase/TPR repeat protein
MNEPTHPEVAILNAALELHPAERPAYLDRACADNATLRLQVEALLRAHEQAGDFLSKTIPMRAADIVLGRTGVMIGRYKLLEQIGEGGFGVVYMAEQVEPVQRKVALKIIKPGMDTRAVIARFEAERQALALMDHPNIAKVLDAGATAASRPYFVMELVRGIPITDYCDQSQLSAAERLHLFMKVCQAVQHAHQKGIIHRDIKPTNVLLTLHDGAPVPKVIDFGVAKALGQKLTEKTLFTAFQQMIGTPAYMSPEQAELSGLDVDTRSDIYSLGVLLYELLTGATPLEKEILAKAGLDEVRRMIRETEPPKPSTRLRMLGDKLPEVAKRRHADPATLSRLVGGDLDWIVMKCLEKDRSRRYDTANGLAMDIQRHLHCEPVLARPPSKFYEFQKTVRRHKVGFAATAAVIVSLLLGLAVSTWMFVRERQERARESAARLEADVAHAKSAANENLRLATILYNLRRYPEAEQLLDQVPPDLVDPDSQHATMRRNLGWWHGLNEEWTKAAANFAAAIQFEDPTNWDNVTMDDVIYAAALLKQADTAAYDDFRRTMIAQYLQTTNPVIAERLCRIGLTLPADVGEMRSMDRLYEVMKTGLDDDSINGYVKPWGRLGLALVDYRRANYLQAVEWCNSSRKLWNSGGPGYEATAHVICALAYQGLGHKDAAQSELAAGRRRLEQQVYSGTDNVWGLITGLYIEKLLHEAAVRIEGGNPHDPGYGLHQAALGELYTNGKFVNLDSAKALACFVKSAEEGVAKHEYDIGVMYARGVGTPTNLEEAFRWFSKVASQTNLTLSANFEQWGGPGKRNILTYVAAWIQLGLMCAHGQGVTEDAAQANSWFQKVAEYWSHGADEPVLLNELAWSLAAARDPNARFGPAAVFLAEAAVQNCGPLDKPLYMDTLAAAYAETGDFDKAVATEKESIGLLTNQKSIDDFTTRLNLYEANTPYREGN